MEGRGIFAQRGGWASLIEDCAAALLAATQVRSFRPFPNTHGAASRFDHEPRLIILPHSQDPAVISCVYARRDCPGTDSWTAVQP